LKSLTRVKIVVACVVSLSVAVTVAIAPASGFRKHLCGVSGTVLKPQEWCPGYSPRHHWRRVVGYRNDSERGVEMCVIVNSKKNRYIFSRCSQTATSIYIRPRDLNYGRRLTRAYNKNNNVAVFDERRYLYATTGRN
jgi:hypothetical protein